MIISNTLFTSLGVNEGSLLTILVDFKKLSVIFDLDTLLFESFLDESISRVTILNELIVGIDNGEGVDGGKSTVRLSPSPDFVGNEEIETFVPPALSKARSLSILVVVARERKPLLT